MARISLVKLILHPNLCRAIPYIVTKPIINKLQSQLLSFILDNKKKSRVNKNLLFLDSKIGGLGVPDISRYVTAVLLDQIPLLWSSSPSHSWVQLENDPLVEATCRDWLTAIIWASLPQRKRPSYRYLMLSPSGIDTRWIFLSKSDIPLSAFKCWAGLPIHR